MRYVQSNKRAANREGLIQAGLLLGFALFFYITIRSGSASLYVHPRIIPYMKISIAGMVILAFFVARATPRRPKRSARLTPYLIFFIPLITAFALPPAVVDSTNISGSSFQAMQRPQPALQIDIPGDSGKDGAGTVAPVPAPNPAAGNSITSDADQSQLKLVDNKIILNDDNFLLWNNELNTNLGAYKGKTIEAVGTVYQDIELAADQFGIVRFMMSCCTADVVPAGFLCRYDQARTLKEGSWLLITGTIDQEIYEGDPIPLIQVEKLAPAEKPENEYLYP